MSTSRTPTVLIIRDGWGANPFPEHDAFNAVKLARTPVADMLWRDFPTTLVKTSGEDVGIPEGTMGNSEVGHQNIGAGRIVDQESVAITKACRAGLEHNHVISAAIRRAGDAGRAVHLMGICSDAGVHGMLEHLYAILRACRTLRHDKVYLHMFMDGRDTGPFTGKGYLESVEEECGKIGVGKVVSVVGRYYAMDRDFRWERVARAYACLTGHNSGSLGVARSLSAQAAVQAYYDAPTSDSQQGDEFVAPVIIAADAAEADQTRIKDGDSVIFFNYRGDRPREISSAFLFPDAAWQDVKPSPDSGVRGFDRGRRPDVEYVIMTEYWDALLPLCKVAFPKPPKMVNILGEAVSRLGLRQFRCAETEKFPHVTFFFNDYREDPYPGESRTIVQSPKVATYDLQPEMSAPGVCDAVLARLAAPDCEELIVVNFANGDMVGHTGKLDAAVRAVETVDALVGRLIDATLARSGSLIVTADHGNCEQMFDPATKAPHTAHTTFDVPLHIVGDRFRGAVLRGDADVSGWFRPQARAGRGRLADIAPTLMQMMGVDVPAEMSGQSLIAT